VQKIFLILSTDNIGGAEKRFVGLWKSICETRKDIDFVLTLSPKLYSTLSQQDAFANALVLFQDHVIQFDLTGGFKKFQAAVKQFNEKYLRENDILHFVGDHPLLPLPGRKQVYSITQSSLKNLNFSGRLGQLAGISKSDKIDILDPNIYNKVCRWFFYKRKHIHRTSNSFCDLDFSNAMPFEQRNDWFVFSGRFELMKQVKQLLMALPSLYKEIKNKATKDLHFYFMGYGSLENELKEMMGDQHYKDLPITITYSDRPGDILSKSKIFFSVQLHNNYPSRSLIEAMATGNIPVVTDVGQTRWLAKPEFSYYVPENFQANDIINAVRKIYSETDSLLSTKSVMARQLVMAEHTIEKMRDYYLGLYKEV